MNNFNVFIKSSVKLGLNENDNSTANQKLQVRDEWAISGVF